MKVGKKLLRDNTGPGSSLDNDRFMRAIMKFRNTPMQDCRRSPAQMVLRRTLQDFLPVMLHKYKPAKDWIVTQETGIFLENKQESDNKEQETCETSTSSIEDGSEFKTCEEEGEEFKTCDEEGVDRFLFTRHPFTRPLFTRLLQLIGFQSQLEIEI